MLTSCADDAFSASRARFEQVCGFMGGAGARSLTHGDLEARLTIDVRDLVRQLYQDHLDLRAAREERLGEVLDAEGTGRPSVEVRGQFALEQPAPTRATPRDRASTPAAG